MNKDQETCLLASDLSQLDTTMFTALLTDANIPWFIKDKGTGGYMKIYMGYTIYGQDIYVGSDDYDRAKELLDYYFSTSTPEDPEQASLPEIEESELPDEGKHLLPFKRGTVARLILFFSILSVLCAWLLSRYL